VEQPTRKRPFGVTVIIILQILSTLLLASDVVNKQILSIPTIIFNELFGRIESASIGVAVIALIYQLVVAIGLLRLKRWAWLLIMVQLGVGMAIDLWAYTNGTPNYPRMLINVFMVFYLNQRDVQQAFGHQRVPEEII
jgi:uncharacterized membrane protein (DUF2068 family)